MADDDIRIGHPDRPYVGGMSLSGAIEVTRRLMSGPRLTHRERYAVRWVCRVAEEHKEHGRPTQRWLEPPKTGGDT